jgi:PKD repeat protein/N-acetyl-anhydromuramyl-L-alanine amidase AmpD
MKHLLLIAGLLILGHSSAQNLQFLASSALVYEEFPTLPKGILEAVSQTQTRMQYLDGTQMESCLGLPVAYGYLGLFADGKSYFKANLVQVAEISGESVFAIKQSKLTELRSYAKALLALMNAQVDVSPTLRLRNALLQLSALPEQGIVNQFARNAELYEIARWMNDSTFAADNNFSPAGIDLVAWFGATNAQVLGSCHIQFLESGIKSKEGITYLPAKVKGKIQTKSTEYGPAIWNPAPSCNFSSRNGTAISAITIHTIQGTYAGAISWSQNCSSSVSYHYVIRSSDGQITQMVVEANKAWHVGSENPYTIGYEHEGYVSQTGWYTTAMYNASAALSRDICSSGYGINPLRTFFGAATTGTNTLGSCVKIKGHQHYLNQTHTDPGINWDWERYYQLINNTPLITTVSTATGSFYDSGGSTGNYGNDERNLTLIQPTGATSLTINFTSFSIESNWDYLIIRDGATLSSPIIGTYTGTNSPGTISATGGALLMEFRSDCATVGSGWAANWTSVTGGGSGDVLAPTTAISTPNGWKTQPFTATFNDADNTGGSGIEKAFYQVIDYDGSDWRANAQQGFFSDNFDLATIHAEWTSAQGTWILNNGNLKQTDEANGNTNMYAFVNHSLSNRYLYHWAGSMSGAGTTRRAGLHYFCDAPTATNRGNSYFVYFRLDDAKVQLYKVTNDVFSLVDEVSFVFSASQWYDFKVSYDRITGKHQVYIDNVLVQTWTDTAPLSSGNYFSFRSGNCVYEVNNMKIYRSRYPSTTVTVGPTAQLRYQSTNPSTVAGRIKSIVQDAAGNLSSISSQDVFVDWTAPADVIAVNDGPGADLTTTTSTSTLEANWASSSDVHSDVARYYVAVGTTPGGTELQNWTDNYWYDSVTVTGLSLTLGSTYYISVKAENGAGLVSDITTSNGITVVAPTSPPVANFTVQNTFVCINDSLAFTNNSIDATSFLWTAIGAVNSSSTSTNPSFQFPSTGNYTIQLIAYGPTTSDTISQNIYVQVSPLNAAAFSMSQDTVYLPNATVTFTNTSQNANGYVWNFGDGVESQDINPWHPYQSAGIYTVKLVAVNNSCPQDTAVQTVVVISNLGISKGTMEDVVLSPNPASDYLNVLLPQAGGVIHILDMTGKIIYEKQVKAEFVQIQLSQWAVGAYVLKYETGGYHAETRFLKK